MLAVLGSVGLLRRGDTTYTHTQRYTQRAAAHATGEAGDESQQSSVIGVRQVRAQTQTVRVVLYVCGALNLERVGSYNATSIGSMDKAVVDICAPYGFGIRSTLRMRTMNDDHEGSLGRATIGSRPGSRGRGSARSRRPRSAKIRWDR